MPGFLLDLDGTLYHGDRPIPHAAEFIAWLREERFPFLFLTNNSSRTPEQVAEHLRKTGIDASPEEVLTTAQAAAMYLKEQGFTEQVCIIGEDGLKEALTEQGISWFEAGASSSSGLKPSAVVQGIDRSFSYAKLSDAVKHIRAGAAFVLTNPDHLLPWNGELTPGAGSIASSIERASERPPVIIGKPSPIIMRYAVSRLGLPAEEVWAVGDNLRTDIKGGLDAGCRTALVLTGLVSEHEVEQRLREAGIQPRLVSRHLKELKEQLSCQ